MTKVLNGMKRMEKIVVAITAEWCGACKRIKKQLHEILRSNTSGIPATNIDLDMMGDNPTIPAPTSVPSIGVYMNGKLVKKIESVDELSTMLQTKPSASQPSANQASANQASANKTPKQTLVSANDEEEEEEKSGLDMASVSIQPNASGRPASVTMNPVTPIVPPSAANDQMPSNTSTTTPSNQVGGNLYGALTSTAYQLAPPAILLGIASATLGSRKRRAKKSKRTRRR
jgi:thiol-disulfide isomerase/thioredoxin